MHVRDERLLQTKFAIKVMYYVLVQDVNDRTTSMWNSMNKIKRVN